VVKFSYDVRTLSDKASAAVANAALKDAGLITDLDKTLRIWTKPYGFGQNLSH